MLFINLKRGLIYAGILASVFSVAVYLIFSLENRNLENRITEVVKADLPAYADGIEHKFTMVAGDLFLIKDLLLARDCLVRKGTGTEFKTKQMKAELEKNFINWLHNRNVYDQIRVLDNTGREIIRVNYNNGQPYIVKMEDLQNKANRYYFANAVNLDDDTLYISKLDLNIENGEIEMIGGRPKPMLRVATPLCNARGERLGLLIINYLAADLFHRKQTLNDSAYTRFEVINENGFYVHAAHEDMEFGFMYKDRQDEVFAKYHGYDVFKNRSDGVLQEKNNDEIYFSLGITETSLATVITDAIKKSIDVVSESGSLLVFGEVEYYKTEEFKKLLVTYTAIGIVLVLISFVIARLLDALDHSRKEQLMALQFNSTHDLLTKLPNRLCIFDAIEYKISRGHTLSVLFLDLDGFKQINDAFGHDVGDKALIEAAARLKNGIRKDDLIARIGGDEFLILLNDLGDKQIISRICRDIIADFSRAFVLDGNHCTMGISIGVDVAVDRIPTELLIKNADAAMYSVKHGSKNDFCFFDEIPNEPASA